VAKFKFIGKDGSMGYKHGEVYRGSVSTYSSVDGTVLFIPGVWPFNIFSKSMVIPYGSYDKFKENWQEV